ncbi:unannotated protein [freshwater metagenome]|uniref:Unannotated protein n=1 Tax=freshwater metagenome TaxID=449393 RepID=A0A6J6L6T5_9ZZZZ
MLTHVSIAFPSSSSPTIGCEFEATIVDRSTFEPAPIPHEIVSSVGGQLDRGALHLELYASTLELTTDICSSVSEVRQDLLNSYSIVRSELHAHA